MHKFAASFTVQADRCRAMNAPLYGTLLDAFAAELDAGGPVGEVVNDWQGDADRDFLPLRLMAAAHFLALTRIAPELAEQFPSAGGADTSTSVAWTAFRNAVLANSEKVRGFLRSPPQTNDVRRSAPLLLGFLEIARTFSLPLSLREIGASAGLNLVWDQYSYALGAAAWGDPASLLCVAAPFDGPSAALEGRVEVFDRKGCDLRPLRVGNPDQRRLLESYIWASEVDRLKMFRSAADTTAGVSIILEQASAGDWIEEQLERQPAHIALVIYHSAVWPYLRDEEQRQIVSALNRVGAKATLDQPLAWLRLEDDASRRVLELRLTSWPGGDRLLATVHPLSRAIRWRASRASAIA